MADHVVYLDTDDVATYVEKLGKSNPNNKKSLYNALSTIILGKDGANYVAKNFKIHEDLLLNVFDDCTLKTLGVTKANTQYFKPTTPAATPRVTRASTASYNKEAKGGSGRAIAGRRVRIPIPAAQAAGLRKFFGKATARKTATVIFPNIVTIPQICMWILTHLSSAKVNDIPYFIMESGSKIFLPSYPASLADFDKQIGEFSTTAKAALDDDAPVVEQTP